MARYIDADELYKKIFPLDLVDKKLYTINAKAVADAIVKTPTADVVQRAEAEATLKQYKDTVKSEVAREIFEEIEKIIDKRYNQHIFGCNDLDDEEHEAIINFSDDVSGDVDDLKKKYTEGGDG